MNIFSNSSSRVQTTRLLLLAIIVLTVPCYCLGAVMLAYAPDRETPTPPVTDATLGSFTQTPRYTPTITPFATWTSTVGGSQLWPTPGQLYLPTNTPLYVPPTSTPFPTWTPLASLTLTTAPTLTLSPTNTLPPSATSTASPTVTDTPTETPTSTETATQVLSPTTTATDTATYTPTLTPTPTDTSVNTPEPSPTQENGG